MTNKSGIRLLVCGGRYYGYTPPGGRPHTQIEMEKARTERKLLWDFMTLIWRSQGISCLINGKCTGADEWARAWAKHNGISVVPFPAEWMKFGKSAGPIRNALMIQEGKPDLVAAFEGGPGTADMVRKARAAGIEVRFPNGEV